MTQPHGVHSTDRVWNPDDLQQEPLGGGGGGSGGEGDTHRNRLCRWRKGGSTRGKGGLEWVRLKGSVGDVVPFFFLNPRCGWGSAGEGGWGYSVITSAH